MITKDVVRSFARYNAWQNQSLYAAADTLHDAARTADRGAFFQSIHGTLSHLIWADHMWMHRFAGLPKPAVGIKESPSYFSDWAALKQERAACDGAIQDWADALDPAWLVEDLVWYSGAVQREMRKPRWKVVLHFFNHQTHHRGQAHAMLTAAGAKPDDTDIILMPD
ncbi:MAG: DinB family protein [Beijerinckiaceae bacterium]